MPPKTRSSWGLAAATASAAAMAISENICHSGSTSKSQCDLLFGSFQIITASIIIVPPNRCVNCARPGGQRSVPADEYFALGVVEDIESGTTEHGFNSRAIGNPPVSGITGEAFFDEIQFWKIRPFEHVCFPKFIVLLDRCNRINSTLKRLKNQNIASDMLVNEIKRKQWVAQMIKNSQEQNEIESFA